MGHKEKYEDGDIFTWLQVHNLLPILTFILGIIYQYYIFQGKVEVLTQKFNVQEIYNNQSNSRLERVERLINNYDVSPTGNVKGVASPSGLLKR